MESTIEKISSKLGKYFDKDKINACFKRARKEQKKLANKCPKPTAWNIIKTIA